MGWKKKLIITTLIGASIFGTLTNNKGFAPFHNKKVGTSGGINLGVYTEFMPGSKFYGINASIYTKNNEGTINGLDLNVKNENQGGTNNGIKISLGNFHDPTSDSNLGKLNGLEIGIINLPATLSETSSQTHPPIIVNGVQIGGVNSATAGRVLQLGFYDYNELEGGKNSRKSLLVNYRFK